MFKVIHVTDTHFGLETHGIENPRTGLNTRTEDAFQAFDQLVSYALSEKVSLVIHSGDVFNTKSVSQSVVNAFYARLKQLSDAGIDVYILQGNHDASKNLTRLTGLDIANTMDFDKITVTRGGYIKDLGYVQVASVSYWNTPEEVTVQIDELAKQIDWTRPAILVCHMQVEYANFPGSFKYDLPFVPLASLTSKPWTYVALGHIHKPQMLNENPPVLYGGSLVRCSATEENDKKGFWAFDIDGTKCENLKQIEVGCLKFLTFRGKMSDLKNAVKGQSLDFSNTIVRIILDDTNERIDDNFIRDTFVGAFKYTVSKESIKNNSIKIDIAKGISMQNYLEIYFEKDTEKKELLQIVEELKGLDESKATA